MRRPLALLALLAAASAAADEGPPRTRYGVVVGARAPTGALASRYGVGGVVGMEAGYMPSWFGFLWSLQYARFWASDPRNVEDLQLYDFDFMVRARMVLPGQLPAFLWVQLGGSLVRSNVPIEPALASSYIGWGGGLGAEMVLGPFLVSIGADYTMLGDGPSGLRLLVFGGVGAR